MTIQEAIPFGEWYRWVLMPVLAYLVWRFTRLAGSPGRPDGGFYFLASLYVLGKICQLFVELPGFYRWYLSDIGFVPCTAFLIAEFLGRRTAKQRLNDYQRYVTVAFIIALLIEWMQMVATTAGRSGAARGDFVDIMLYMVSASFAIYLIDRARWSQPI